jgi:hypothetical protein
MLAAGAASALGAETPETSHLAFVTEYVRELAAIEKVRASAEQEVMQATTKDEKLLSAIHGSSRIQVELRFQIDTLKGMHLNDPFDQLVPDFTVFYQHKIVLHQRLIDISSTFLGGPKPGIDYGKRFSEPNCFLAPGEARTPDLLIRSHPKAKNQTHSRKERQLPPVIRMFLFSLISLLAAELKGTLIVPGMT